ncbi:MAG: type II toxin-antitoxin system prevent-host-death family antitoxin [Anaerolineae bacterium]
MSKSIGIAEARERLSHLVNEVAYGAARYVVQRRGKPLVIIINIAEYESLIQLLSKAKILDQIHGIPVVIHSDGKRFFITDEQFDLYGTGPTLDIAREDYWLAVQEYYADLSADADRLAPYLAERLTKLRDILAQTKET